MSDTGGEAVEPLPVEPRALEALKSALDAGAPVIVELHLAASAGTPERLIFHRYEMLASYLRMVARAGDRLAAWRFDHACRADNTLVAPLELQAPS